MKVCKKCNIEKSLDDFSNLKSKGKVYKQSNCKQCRSEYRNWKRKQNPIIEAYRKRRQTLRSKYNIEIEDYDRMYNEQKGCCAICDTNLPLLAVDHDHNTLEVRGLLCLNCNTGIGQFKDSIPLLYKACKYLAKKS